MYKIISKYNGSGINDIYSIQTAETLIEAEDLYKRAVCDFMADYSESFDIPLSTLYSGKNNDEYEYNYTYGPKRFCFVSYDSFDRCVTTIRIVTE